MVCRNRTPSECISYGSYLYFSGLSLRRASERLPCFVKRNHVSIWNWIQKYHPQRIPTKRKKVFGYVVDETLTKVGSEYIWLWAAVEPKNRQVLALDISKERNMLVAERLVEGLVKAHGKCPVPTDCGTWYPQACRFLNLRHHIHSPLEKSLIERTVQYIKDRTESFDDYFPCRIKNCKLKHVKNWLRFCVDHHNNELKTPK
jgi:putative transposase